VYAVIPTDSAFLVYKSLDYGTTWTALSIRPVVAATIAVDPHNSNILCLAGPGLFFKSTDGGSNWQDLHVEGQYSNIAIDAERMTDPAAVFTDPGNSANLYIAHLNGLLRSTDEGASWTFTPIVGTGEKVLSLGIPAR
jgi:hypothetical protein